MHALHQWILYLPALTTVCATLFTWQLFTRYRAKGGGLHLLWWGIGMVTYGLGTFTEAYTSILGWDPTVFRIWYVAGAFLGGYPLAQGSIYLLMNRRFAHRSAWIVSSLIAIGAVFVFLTPLSLDLVESHRLSGRVIQWHWVRLVSPLINLYSLVFLAGGAIVSARRFRRSPALRNRYVGNILIAIGAILPGIGGSMTRAGLVEALYVTELVGLCLIYWGYRKNISNRPVPEAKTARRYQTVTPALVVTLALLAMGPRVVAQETVASEDDGNRPAAEVSEENAAAQEEPTSFFASTTVTATGTETDAFEVSTPVTILKPVEIQRRAADNAAELLKSEPGVDVSGVGPNQTRPVIRGQRGLRILLLENGLRLNNPRRQTDFGEIPGLVDIETVESVEIVRGPASVLYGSDAIGGVLNLVTRRAAIGGGGWRGGAGLLYGSAGEMSRASGDIAASFERFAFSLGATTRQVDDYSAPAGKFGDIRLTNDVRVIDSAVDDDTLRGSFSWQINDSQQLSFRATSYQADQAGFGLVEPGLLDGDDSFRIRILYPFQDVQSFTLGYLGAFEGSALVDTLHLQAYRRTNERQLVNDIDVNIGPLFPGAPDSSVAADTKNFTDVTTTGLRLEATKALGQNHQLTYGGEVYQDEVLNTDFSRTTTTLRFPFPPFAIEDVSIDAVANTPNATNSSYGLFAQAAFQPAERWTVTAGARFQTVDTKADPTPGLDIQGLDFDDSSLVGALSAVYRLTDTLNIVASYGTAFRAPSIVERLFNGPTPEGSGFQLLNPDLVSEESENIELGLKYLRSNSIFEFNIFRNDIDNGIIQNFLTEEEIGQLPPELQAEIAALRGDFVVQQTNADRLRYQGIEVVVGQRFANGLIVGGNYTYLDGERLDSTNPPTGDTFSRKINAYLRYEPKQGRYWAEYRLRHNAADRASLDSGEPVPPVGEILPAFTVHTLSGGYRLYDNGRQHHDIQLVIDNLSDELYAEFSNATFFRPQPERNVKLTYRLRLD